MIQERQDLLILFSFGINAFTFLLKGVEPAFVEKRGFLTGATDKTTLDFHNFFSGTDRTILDLETSPSKFF